MSFGDEIKRLRAERGWSQYKLAEKAGIPRTSLASIEINRSVPKMDMMLKLASALKIRPEELYHAAGYIQYFRPIFPWQKEKPEELLDRFRITMPATVPIYDEFPLHAGSPVEPVDQVAFVRHRVRGRNLEGYIARGKCLEPDIKDGNIIIVDRDGRMDNGDIVAALVNGELYLARVRKIADEIYFENNEGRIRLEDCQFAVPVIEVRRRLK